MTIDIYQYCWACILYVYISIIFVYVYIILYNIVKIFKQNIKNIIARKELKDIYKERYLYYVFYVLISEINLINIFYFK